MVRDQAETLRRSGRVRRSAPRQSRRGPATRVVSFTGGKGGVGKTACVVNVGAALAAAGNEVLVLDADVGLANADILLGVEPVYSVHDVVAGARTLEESVVAAPCGVTLLPAGTALDGSPGLGVGERLALVDAIERSSRRFDYLLVDTPAGVSEDVLFWNAASSEVVCVVTPEPTSLTDAYALIKLLSLRYRERSVSVVVNDVTGGEGRGGAAAADAEARRVFGRLSSAVERFLHVSVRYLGHVPSDPCVPASVRLRSPAVTETPSGPASLAFGRVAARIEESAGRTTPKGGVQVFFGDLLGEAAR